MRVCKLIKFEEVKTLFEKEGYQLISTEYKNSKAYLSSLCPKKHTVSITYDSFRSGVRCSECRGLKKKTIDQVRILFEDNNYNLISTEYVNGHGHLHSKCPYGHDCFTSYTSFKRGHRCGTCSGTKNKTLEEIRGLFEKEGYVLRNEYYENGVSILKTTCPLGHEYLVRYGDFQQGYRCSSCYGNKKKKIEEVSVLFEKEGYQLISPEYTNSGQLLEVVCPKKHSISITYNNFQQGVRCSSCVNNGISTPEKEIYNFIKILCPDAEENDRKQIAPKELDIFIPSLNLAIEYNGLYWHSEEYTDKNYHTNKMKLCNEKGIRLITVFEDEWLYRQDQVKNFLLSVINKNSIKIMARKTDISVVTKEKASIFLEENHIQGTTNFEVAFGLYHKNELLGVITGNKHHRQGNGDSFILNRLAFKSGVSVSGGASKLLKALINYTKQKGYEKLISWSDNRWSEGRVYKALGFVLDEEMGADYSYVQKQVRISKQSCQKKNLLKKGGIGNTEREMALSLGLYRIWDCGKKRWSIDL